MQLIDRDGIFKYRQNENGRILIVTASRWLSSLP
jgi:hypothetical protein